MRWGVVGTCPVAPLYAQLACRGARSCCWVLVGGHGALTPGLVSGLLGNCLLWPWPSLQVARTSFPHGFS